MKPIRNTAGSCTYGLAPRASGMKPLGVVAAALISAALLRGRAGVKELLARLARHRSFPRSPRLIRFRTGTACRRGRDGPRHLGAFWHGATRRSGLIRLPFFSLSSSCFSSSACVRKLAEGLCGAGSSEAPFLAACRVRGSCRLGALVCPVSRNPDHLASAGGFRALSPGGERSCYLSFPSRRLFSSGALRFSTRCSTLSTAAASFLCSRGGVSRSSAWSTLLICSESVMEAIFAFFLVVLFGPGFSWQP